MAEKVVAIDVGVTWEPNAPEAVLVSSDDGRAGLALRAHPDDSDRRCVVLLWSGVSSARMAEPNDEAIRNHRLYSKGLSDVVWAGLVLRSEVIRSLEAQNRVHPSHDPSRFKDLTHYVVPLKECVVEVVADVISVQRFDGATLDAVATALRR